MVKPARSLMPCTPMNTWSTCNERSAFTATGPTSASEGVRTPPVSTTVRSGRWAACSVSATRTELVTTTRSGTPTMSSASCHVVVPAVSPMAVPGCTIWAAATAMERFSPCWRWDFASNPGSSVARCSTAVAPPCTFSSNPAAANVSRSRRIVMSDTRNISVSSLTRTPPERTTSPRISSWRRRASTRAGWRPAGSAALACIGERVHDRTGEVNTIERRAKAGAMAAGSRCYGHNMGSIQCCGP